MTNLCVTIGGRVADMDHHVPLMEQTWMRGYRSSVYRRVVALLSRRVGNLFLHIDGRVDESYP